LKTQQRRSFRARNSNAKKQKQNANLLSTAGVSRQIRVRERALPASVALIAA